MTQTAEHSNHNARRLSLTSNFAPGSFRRRSQRQHNLIIDDGIAAPIHHPPLPALPVPRRHAFHGHRR
jgi:hypothetical protein